MSKKRVFIVAVDGSEWSERAALRAVNLAAEVDAEVKLVTVIPWSGFSPMSIEELSTRPVAKKEEENHAHNKILNPLVEAHKDKGVEITTHFDWGNPAEVISKLAKDTHANMVFVGRRGRSSFADLILGSVANSLAHRLGVPIVLVP